MGRMFDPSTTRAIFRPVRFCRYRISRSDVTVTSNDAFAAVGSLPFSNRGGPFNSTAMPTSCPASKRRAPTGAFLSNRMRDAMALGVDQNRLNVVLRHFEPFRDFGDSYAIVAIIDNPPFRPAP